MSYSNMMTIPFANPVNLIRATNQAGAYFIDRLPAWEQKSDYLQKYNMGDRIRLQIIYYLPHMNISGAYVRLCKVSDKSVILYLTPDFSWVIGTSWTSVSYSAVIPATVAEGEYYLEAYAPYWYTSDYEKFYSEKLSLKTYHENTILLSYSNDGNDFDLFFGPDQYNIGQTRFDLRIEGGIRSINYQPASSDSAFIDQTYGNTLLSSVPYNIYTLTLADNYGIPNWMIDKANRALSCNDLKINGLKVSKAEGAKLAPKIIDDFYPKRIWTIDMVLSENPYSDRHNVIKIKPDSGGFIGIGNLVINPPYGWIPLSGFGPFVINSMNFHTRFP